MVLFGAVRVVQSVCPGQGVNNGFGRVSFGIGGQAAQVAVLSSLALRTRMELKTVLGLLVEVDVC
jgi:hypothetical protein